MRWLLFAVVGACSFPNGSLEAEDAPRDTKPDMGVTWAIDAQSNKGVPANATEWTKLTQAYNLTTATPDHLWLMQETMGNLQDSIGTVVLNEQGGPLHQQQVPGWSHAAVGTIETTTMNQGFITYALGNLDGTSYLLLLYLGVSTMPPDDRSICGIGAQDDHRYVAITSAPLFKGAVSGGSTATTGKVDPMTSVHPVVLSINASGLKYAVYTDQEKITVSWVPTNMRGNLLEIGSATIGSAATRYLYGALWQGAKAEMSDAQVKQLLESLGWMVSGY